MLRDAFREYRQTLQPDRRHLVEEFELVDFARKVVGVGSVGTRCWVAFMLGRDESDPLFLQIKEAEASVLEPYVGKSAYENHGRRVVEGQRFMQSASDIFLGWDRLQAPRRERARLLRAPDVGREVLGADRAHGAGGARGLRRDVRIDAGPRPRRARATASRSRATSGRATRSTARSRSSPRRTPTRTSATSRKWSPR